MTQACLMGRELCFERSAGGTVLDRIDAVFDARAPALVTGATGSGKSTLLHLLGGMLRPTRGEVWADGRPVSRWAAVHRDAWRRQVGMVFQHLHLIPDLTVLENLLLPCIPHRSGWSDRARQAAALLDRFDLPQCRNAMPQILSGGQQQRVAWVRALIVQPRYLLLDEPTAFQDDAHTREFMLLLTEKAAQGACVVVCSHDVRLRGARGLFQYTYRLHQGRLESL